MKWPLLHRVPSQADANSDLILDRFLDYAKEKRIDLYPAQEEAILELVAGKNVILNTPTGSGKSLVALSMHFDSLCRGRRSIYTSPIKALVNEKFFSLCHDFGPENVGMITGDSTVNPNAPIICCTAEILAIDALRDGARAKIDDVVMDEFHYYSDRERGVAWQVPLLTLPQARFLLMSATLGDTTPFVQCLGALTQKDTAVVISTDRPVPLDFQYSERPLHEAVAKLIESGRSPVYLVSFTQRECAEQAQNFMSVELCTRDEKQTIAAELHGFKFSSPYGKELQKFIKHGMGIHHGGLLPKYRVLIEKLAQKGLLKIIFGTDTLGVGVNVPIRSVLFTKLCKYDGEKTVLLSVRDFKQISGRAGRKGFDDLGTVVVQAPEHVIENIRNEQKAAGDAKRLKKLVKRKPPEKGFLPWGQDTFQRLVNGQAEALTSRFKVTHAMLLNVLARPNQEGCRAMQNLLKNCHESPKNKKKLRDKAFELFRSLVDRKIIEFKPLRVNLDLQEDFSLNHVLSLYLIDTIQLIDPTSDGYALNVLTLVESILENPDLILRRQLDRLKTEKIQELKSQGVEYDERMIELEKLEYPKPNRDFIYGTFNQFADRHPWVEQENIRPKSIAREIYEGFYSFSEYIREYDLHRAEGLLLRYLSDVYKVLAQNVPEAAKTEEVFEMGVYFGAMVRGIDSSLLDEWSRLKNPEAELIAKPEGIEAEAIDPTDITRNERTFTVLIRNQVFRFIKCFAAGRFEEALESLDFAEGAPKTVDDLKEVLKIYLESDHSKLCTDAKARGPNFFQVQKSPTQNLWQIEQIMVDPEGHNDWSISLTVDLQRSRTEARPCLQLTNIRPA